MSKCRSRKNTNLAEYFRNQVKIPGRKRLKTPTYPKHFVTTNRYFKSPVADETLFIYLIKLSRRKKRPRVTFGFLVKI